MNKIEKSSYGPLFLRALELVKNENIRITIGRECKQIAAEVLKKYYNIYSVADIHQACYNTIGILSAGLFSICENVEDPTKAAGYLQIYSMKRLFRIGYSSVWKMGRCMAFTDTKWMQHFKLDESLYSFNKRDSINESEIYMMESISGEVGKRWLGGGIIKKEIKKADRFLFLKWFSEKYFKIEMLEWITDDLKQNTKSLYLNCFRSAVLSLLFLPVHDFSCLMISEIMIKNEQLKEDNVKLWKSKLDIIRDKEIPAEWEYCFNEEIRILYRFYISKGKVPKITLYKANVEQKIISDAKLKLKQIGIVKFPKTSIKREVI